MNNKLVDQHSKKVIVISGGDQGFGYWMAVTFLEAGHNVIVLDLNGDNILNNNKNFVALNQLYYFKCDVSNEADVTQSIALAMEQFQRIDILINNAALAIFKSFEEKNIDETQAEFEINYYGYINMIKAVLPYMKQKKYGFIYNVSSGVGITGFSGLYGYVSTKGAIEGLTKTLAYEFKDYDIQVGLIHPPLMHTRSSSPLGIPKEMMSEVSEMGKKMVKKILNKPFKPILTPDFKTGFSIRLLYKYPYFFGNLFNKNTMKITKK